MSDNHVLTYPVPTGTANSTVTDMDRYMYYLGGGPITQTLSSQLHTQSGLSISSSDWLTSALSQTVAFVDPTLNVAKTLYPDTLTYTSSYYFDYEFVIEHVTTFDYNLHRAHFSGTGHTQDYWSPGNSPNGSFTSYGTYTHSSTSLVSQTGTYYELEKRTVRVYYRKDEITNVFSIDTRITYGQPDSAGGLPDADPNEPAQFVDFSNSVYKGGLFLGRSATSGSPKDKSGRAILQGVAPFPSLGGGQIRIGRAMSLFSLGRETSPGYSTGTIATRLAAPQSTTTTSLSELISSQKRWSYRWPVTMASGSPTAEPNAVDILNIGTSGGTDYWEQGPIYSWNLGSDSVTGSNQLFAIYPAGLDVQSTSEPTLGPTWFYFVGQPFLADSSNSGRIVEAMTPKSWDIVRDPIEAASWRFKRIDWIRNGTWVAP